MFIKHTLKLHFQCNITICVPKRCQFDYFFDNKHINLDTIKIMFLIDFIYNNSRVHLS
jgi:hypothetical protein